MRPVATGVISWSVYLLCMCVLSTVMSHVKLTERIEISFVKLTCVAHIHAVLDVHALVMYSQMRELEMFVCCSRQMCLLT